MRETELQDSQRPLGIGCGLYRLWRVGRRIWREVEEGAGVEAGDGDWTQNHLDAWCGLALPALLGPRSECRESAVVIFRLSPSQISGQVTARNFVGPMTLPQQTPRGHLSTKRAGSTYTRHCGRSHISGRSSGQEFQRTKITLGLEFNPQNPLEIAYVKLGGISTLLLSMVSQV